MKKITDFCALGTLMLSLCLAGVAYAANPPDECNDDGRNERFFDLGVFRGTSLVNQAWASLEPDQCDHDRFLEFVDIVTAALQAADPTDPVLCHYTGTFVGAVERADCMLGECIMECCFAGQMIGEMAAIFYCELSIALGGLGLDEWQVDIGITPCGLEFVRCCQNMFDDVTQMYPSAVDPQCLPYTPYYDPPYDEDVYNQTKHNRCNYELDP